MRGTISTSIGSRPMTRSASISSRIFMEPISAVKAEPERPATMMRGQEHGEFAQDEDADQVDDEGGGAELLKLEDALLGDDAADKERDQHDDRHAAIGDLLELVDHRRAAELRRACDDADQGRDHFPEEGDAADEVPARIGDALADIDQEIDEPGVPDRRPLLEAAIGDLVKEDALLRARVHEIGREALLAELVPGPVEHPGAKGVEPLDTSEVEDDAPAVRLRRRCRRSAFRPWRRARPSSDPERLARTSSLVWSIRACGS